MVPFPSFHVRESLACSSPTRLIPSRKTTYSRIEFISMFEVLESICLIMSGGHPPNA